jgi:hypothetical protein
VSSFILRSVTSIGKDLFILAVAFYLRIYAANHSRLLDMGEITWYFHLLEISLRKIALIPSRGLCA